MLTPYTLCRSPEKPREEVANMALGSFKIFYRFRKFQGGYPKFQGGDGTLRVTVLIGKKAHGCCCVASDCPHGPADLVSDQVNGILMSGSASDEDWRLVLHKLLVNSDMRKNLANQAILVREIFSDFRLERKFIHAVEELCK